MKITIALWRTPLSHQSYIKYRTMKNGRIASYKDSRLAEFQQNLAMLVRSQCNLNKIERIYGEYKCTATFYLANRRRPDLTNIWKTCEDAMEGILYDNDRGCEDLHVIIKYDKENPRMVLECLPLDS